MISGRINEIEPKIEKARQNGDFRPIHMAVMAGGQPGAPVATVIVMLEAVGTIPSS
jgi:hypothetical protein